ncbi:MAG: prepilin-type N-terminal cleavage/methylation domain-containing protein [Pseudoalteromonas tetraodonis]|jgi:prepilin-type N-terminal cleavage/methylation domain-containing protein
MAIMKIMVKEKNPCSRLAFSLVELLITLSVVGVLSSIAMLGLANANKNLDKSKLELDVSRINRAVDVYVSSGGSLEGITVAQDVLTELKKEVSSELEKTVVGQRGSMIDLRLEALSESNGEFRKRAVWNSDEKRFVIMHASNGIREFSLNKALGEVDYGSADRLTALRYSAMDGWVWESSDQGFATAQGPTSIPELDAPTLGASNGSSGANSSTLLAPLIGPNSGIHALATFPLTITLTKPASNPDDAIIVYSTGANSWSRYTSPFEVPPNTTVYGFCSHPDPAWQDSERAIGSFQTNPEALEVALYTELNPVTFAEVGGELEPGNYLPLAPLEPIMVTLPNGYTIPDIYENSDQFQFHWTYDGSDPLTSNTGVTGIKFTKGYKNNNGHGNNYSGIDLSNPNWKQKALNSGWSQEEVDDFEQAALDDEMKPHDQIAYTIDYWNGATILPIRVVSKSKKPEYVTNSIVLSSNISIRKTNLRKTQMVAPDQPLKGDTIELILETDFGDMPAGARIYYTTDGSDPGIDADDNPLQGTLYTGPFDPLLGTAEMDGEVTIVSRVYPPEIYAGWFNVSQPDSYLFFVPTWELTGTAKGGFVENGVLSNSRDDTWTGSYFDWADPSNGAISMFSDISNREVFQIGELSYYNGSGYTSGDVGSFDFTIDLDVYASTERFDFQINQYISRNGSGSAVGDADIISLDDGNSFQAVNIYGTQYQLNIGFGTAGSVDGAISNELQVNEGEVGNAIIYGRLIAIDDWYDTLQ